MSAVVWKGLEIDENVAAIPRTQFVDTPPTISKRHPAYVYSTGHNSCLMHKVAFVELHWELIVARGDKVARLKRPAAIAKTVCGVSKFLTADKARTCTEPKADAVLCGRCHGELPTFSKNGAGTKAGMSRQAAAVKLACEVAGYPSKLERE